MNTAKNSDLREGLSSMKSAALSADCSTETNCPGRPVLSNGVASSHPGDALVVGLLLISLFAAALLMPLEELMPQERNGSRSSPSTSTGSHQKKRPGGTEEGRYE